MKRSVLATAIVAGAALAGLRAEQLHEAHLAQERLEQGRQMGKITLAIG